MQFFLTPHDPSKTLMSEVLNCRMANAVSRNVSAIMAMQQKAFVAETTAGRNLKDIWAYGTIRCIPFNRNMFVERFPKYLRNLGELRYCESCWPCTYLHDCMLVSCYVFLCGTDNCQRVDLTCCETLAKFIRNGYHLRNGTCNENQCNCQNGTLGCKQWALNLD